jgi:hypothetical protein
MIVEDRMTQDDNIIMDDDTVERLCDNVYRVRHLLQRVSLNPKHLHELRSRLTMIAGMATECQIASMRLGAILCSSGSDFEESN